MTVSHKEKGASVGRKRVECFTSMAKIFVHNNADDMYMAYIHNATE